LDRITELKQEKDEVIKKLRSLRKNIENGTVEGEKASSRFDKLEQENDRLQTEIEKEQRKINKGKKEFDDSLEEGEIMNKKLLTRSQKFTDVVEDRKLDSGKKESELSLGKALRGIITGNWENARDEQRAMDSSGSGQYLIPTKLAANVIDLARTKSSIMKAGALTVPMDTNNLSMAKVAGDPEAEWKAENAAVSAESDMTFEKVDFNAKTMYLLISFSLELFEDTKADLLDKTVRNAIAEKMALKLDYAALRGDGAGNNPTGILNTTGILNKTAYGDISDYSLFSYAKEDILNQNAIPNAAIYNPTIWGAVDRFKDSSGQPLDAPQSFKDLNKYVTTQIPSDLGAGSNESEVYVGDFSQLMIGMRSQLKIEVSREASDAFEKGKVYLRAYMRADSQLARPEHFKVIEGITVPA